MTRMNDVITKKIKNSKIEYKLPDSIMMFLEVSVFSIKFLFLINELLVCKMICEIRNHGKNPVITIKTPEYVSCFNDPTL